MKPLSLKRSLVAGLAAITMAGAALGVAGAQQTPPTPLTQQPTTPGPLGGAQHGQVRPGAERHQQLLNAVAAKLGISPDRLQQAFAEARQELGIPERKAGGFRARLGGLMGQTLSVVADTLGISVDQLRQELPGRSLTDLAQAHNVQPSAVATALKNAVNARIDQAAAAGRIPSDQVATAKQQAAQRIDQLMTRQFPANGALQRGPRS